MKKFLAVLLAAVTVACMFVACSKADDKNTTQSTTASVENATDKAKIKDSDAINFIKTSYTKKELGLDKVKEKYDFIIIDCPPALSMLTINAMTTSDSVLVPIQCEYYALEGLSQLIHTIELVQERLNPELEIEGVVFTMYDARTNLSLLVVENVKDNLNQNIYKTIIPRNVRLAEAPSFGMPINLYDPKSKGTESYLLLAEEVINKGEE